MSSTPAHPAAGGQSAADHTTRYEALRAYTVERQAPASRDGLVVLLGQGVAAWMEAWSRLPAGTPRAVQPERPRPSPVPEDVSAEVVHVLVAMTLGHIQEMRA
jgi:hypothetical protein